MTHFLWLRRTSNRRQIRPCLEVLEDRTVPAVFNVAAGDVYGANGLVNTIAAANNNGQSNTINLSAGTYDLTAIDNYWYGPNGLPAITSNLTIHGNGATIQHHNGSPAFRLFYVSGGMELPAGSLTMDNVTLLGGIAEGGSSKLGGGGLGAGGAILNQGALDLTAVTLYGNEAIGGNSGDLTLGAQANGGGGMGGNADSNGNGGGFGGSLGGTFGGGGGSGSIANGGGGGGGGFLAGANGTNGTNKGAAGGGLGAFGGINSSGTLGDGGGGGDGTGAGAGGDGGAFGSGGGLGIDGGGGGGVGGGGGDGTNGGDGGFGGGGGYGFGLNRSGGNAGFGGGGGGSNGGASGLAGFGGGIGGSGGGGGAGLGGAIFNMGADSTHPGSGTVTLINCTFTRNTALGGVGFTGGKDGSGLGGALFNLDGQATLTNDTLASNDGSYLGIDGGAVYNLAFGDDIDTGKAVQSTLVLNNSILANNGAPHDLVNNVVNGVNFNTATVSGSHNLVMTSSGTISAGVIALTANPNLGPLQNNGGLTMTLLPLSGSPVLGAGDPSLAPSTDQRGHARPSSGPTDLGSVQVSVASTGGGSGATSAGFFGLAIEEFELTIDTVLDLVDQIAGLSHAALDATITQLHTAIANDTLTPTFLGQVAIFLGEGAALNALNPQPLPPG